MFDNILCKGYLPVMKNQGGRCSQGSSLVGIIPDTVRHSLQTNLILTKTQQFAHQTGRRPRILVCYVGTSGPRRNLNRVALIFAQWGFDVDIGPMGQCVQHAVNMAIENDVHLISLVCKEENYSSIALELAEALKERDCGHILVMVAGDIPTEIRCPSAPNNTNLIFFNPKTTDEVFALLERLA